MIRIREYLTGDSAELDRGFREDLRSLEFVALRLVGALEAVVPLLMAATGIGIIPMRAFTTEALLPTIAVSLAGWATLGASIIPGARRFSRLLVAVSIWLTTAVLETSVLILNPNVPWIDHFLIGYNTLVKLGGSALPFRPWQTLALGLAIDITFGVFSAAAAKVGVLGIGFGLGQHVFGVITTLACTGLTYAVYTQRVRHYRAQQQARDAQARLLISENAAELGRLAAALSHELNSPIGVLASVVDTLAAAALRAAASDRVRAVIEEAHGAGRQSTQRLRAIVARMQRFTNLDRAEVQPVNVNDLIRDVVALIGLEAEKAARVNLDLQPVPRFVARPQQMSAVFANLVGNAVSAIDGGGRVDISTRGHPNVIEVRVADNGIGMTADELANAFNPAWFRVSGQRIAAGHWSLFSCRQIVQEHGGDIAIESVPGSGTTVRVMLPLSQTAGVE